MAIFGPNPWVNPFGKMPIFGLFELYVFISQKGDFSFQNIMRHFLGLYCLKKKVGKMAIFIPKSRVNHFGKMSIFPLFELYVFITQKIVFFVLEYHKRNFPGLYCLKKKVGKMAIFIPKSRVNHFGKMSIFPLFELYVFITQKIVFFVLEYHKRNFPGLYCLKKKL